MLPILRLSKTRNPQTAYCSHHFFTTRKTTFPNLVAGHHRGATCFIHTKKPLTLMFSKRPQKEFLMNPHITQRYRFSLWNIPLSLMTASPLKRRVTLAALGGAGLAVAVVLGPFLLVGIGGIAMAFGFRLWRIKRDLQSQLQRTGQPLQDWPDFLNAFMQRQNAGVFGNDQRQVEAEALRRFQLWAQSGRGRNQLIEHGINPEKITDNVSMRGSSYSSTVSNGTGTTTKIKIELDLRNSPGTILIASAQLVKDNNTLTIHDMKLVTAAGYVLPLPLSVSPQNPSGGRVIEGEFYDV